MSNAPDVATKPIDPSSYIRTYAKDVAALTGQNITSLHEIPADSEAYAPPKRDDSLLVSNAPSSQPADLSQLEREAEQIGVKKESEQEAEAQLQDSGAASSGILQSIALPRIQTGDIIQPLSSSEQDPQQAGEARESILARLRAKALASTAPTEAPAVTVPPPPPAPAPPPHSPPIKLSAPQPIPEPSRFHSFSSDFSDHLNQQGASTFSVLAAQEDAARVGAASLEPQPRPKLQLLSILAGIFLIIAGAGGVLAAYHFFATTAPIAAIPSISYIIVPDEKIDLTSKSANLFQALAEQASQPLPANTVLLTYITTASTTGQGVIQTPATGGDFLAALNLPAPDILLRNIDPSSMVGIVNDGSQTRPFFILRVTSYERTFAGMLQWEPTIASNLALLYPAYPALPQAVASSTATTSAALATTSTQAGPIFYAPQFVDEVVDNHNARALKDSAGRTVIIYGYADEQTLIIARDEASFTLLLGRLEASQQ